MTRSITQNDLRNNDAKVIDAVAAGDTFLVTRDGEPVAELRPFQPGRRTFISREEPTALVASELRIDRDTFRADSDGLIDPGA